MSTYKFWQPYQQVSLEIKQSRQPSKKYLTYLKQQQKNKTTKKNKQKEPKLSETIKNTKLTAMYKKCQHQVWRILSSRQMKTGTRHISCEYTCTLLSTHSAACHLPTDHRNVNISDTRTQSNPDSCERYTHQPLLRNVFSY